MGFSLAVSVRSRRLKDEMQDFLVGAYKPWSELSGDGATSHFQGPLIDDQLDVPGRCCIGFDYEAPTTGAEREFHFALVRWIALQVGKRRTRFRTDDLTFKAPVPYVVYDGHETEPVLLQAEWPAPQRGLQGYIYDSLGMCTDDSVVRDLAWLCLPEGAFQRVSTFHHGDKSAEVEEALIQEGLPGANEVLDKIRMQLARIDLLWKDERSTTRASL